MQVRAKEPCYVEKQFHEAGEVFDWHNVNNEPLPACMEAVEPEPVTPEAEPEEKRRPGRPKKQG
jgi:hypothetical protein